MIDEALVVFLLGRCRSVLLIGEPPVRIHPVVWIGNLLPIYASAPKTAELLALPWLRQ